MISLKCIFGHDWALQHDTGMHLYHECEKCGKRAVSPLGGRGNQPINKQWLNGGEWVTCAKPKRPGLDTA